MKSRWTRLLPAAALFLLLCGTAAAAFAGDSMKPDQVNTAGWNKAWANLLNDTEQRFKPSLSRLLAVEVELVVGNPGPAEDELTLTVMDSSGQVLGSAMRTVPVSNCAHTMFVFPKEGIEVTPGQTYRLKLSGGITFGWKYVVGGYQKGAAIFNGKPLLSQARSTFLFETFGSE